MFNIKAEGQNNLTLSVPKSILIVHEMLLLVPQTTFLYYKDKTVKFTSVHDNTHRRLQLDCCARPWLL
jgi:hypothetical protein